MNRWIHQTAVCSLLVCVVSVTAHAEPVVIKSARLFVGKSNTLATPGQVVVDQGKIVSVGPGGSPDGATVIDLGDATLMPGFMDAHTHLSGESTDDWKE